MGWREISPPNVVRPWNDMVSKSTESLIICVFRKHVDWMAANVETFFLH